VTQTALRALSHAFRFHFGLMVSLWPLLYLSGFMRILRSVFPAPQGTGEKRLYSVKDRQKKSRLRLEQFRRDGLLLQILLNGACYFKVISVK